MVGSNVVLRSTPYTRNSPVTVIPGIFAMPMPKTRRMTMDHTEVFWSPFWKSVVKDAAAQRLLSTVDSSPLISMKRNGNSVQLGNKCWISSTFTIPESFAIYPDPAAMYPRIPIDAGTTAKKNVPSLKAFPTLSSRIEKALCQKH